MRVDYETTQEIIPGKMTLTTDSTASSYGQPVLRYRGQDYGAGDLITLKDGTVKTAAKTVELIVREWFPEERVGAEDNYAMIDKFVGMVRP